MSYRQFYRMHSDPFPLMPETGVFFESNTHLTAIEFITNCLKEKDIFLLVIGDYGTGKTLLCLKLLEVLKTTEGIGNAIYVPTPLFSYPMILRMIAKALGLTVEKDYTDEKIQEAVYEFYEKPENQAQKVVILLDDFQEHNISSIEHIKWLGSFNTSKGFFPFCLILFAHPAIVEKINSPLLGSLSQKIRKRYYLNAFDELETKEYIYFRLLSSGAKGFPYFQDDTILEIHRITGGIARLINTVCDACLVVGAREEKKIIDKEILSKALLLTGFSQPEKMARPEEPSPRPAPLAGPGAEPLGPKAEPTPAPTPPPPPYPPPTPIPRPEGGLDFAGGKPGEKGPQKGGKERGLGGSLGGFFKVWKVALYIIVTILLLLIAIWAANQLRPMLSSLLQGMTGPGPATTQQEPQPQGTVPPQKALPQQESRTPAETVPQRMRYPGVSQPERSNESHFSPSTGEASSRLKDILKDYAVRPGKGSIATTVPGQSEEGGE